MLTVISNANLAAASRFIVTDRAGQDITIDAGSNGTWVRKGCVQARVYGNIQSSYYVTVAVFELTEPCEDATLIVDGVTDNAGAIVGV